MLPISLYTDRQRVEQILKNLLSNAIKFTERGKVELVFQAHEPDPTSFDQGLEARDWVAITVTDTGIGIPEEKHALIFEPFRQVDDSTNRKYGGTGLGLAICRELATLLEGSIELNSQEGKGSTFSVYLPVNEPPEESSVEEVDGVKPEPKPVQPGSLEAIRDDRRSLGPQDKCVLVVGTDHELVLQQNEVAREVGLGVIVAGDQGAALFLASYYHPVAAILTGDLPGVEAASIVDRLKSAVRWPKLPVLHLAPHGSSSGKSSADEVFRVVPLTSDPSRIAEESSRFLQEVVDEISSRELENVETSPVLTEEITERSDTTALLKDQRILIVEDNMRNVFALTSLLEERGAKVSMAENGRIGLKMIEEGPKVDVVLLDIMMPDMNGYEVLKEIRKNIKFRNLPIIVLTAKALQGERQRCLDAGASDYLPKPVDPPKLLSMLGIWLGQGD
jgi:CheY-like chemotaxis protein